MLRTIFGSDDGSTKGDGRVPPTRDNFKTFVTTQNARQARRRTTKHG